MPLSQEVVPTPGQIPIPDNYVRLYHYTGADPEVIKREGLRHDLARGENYGEPNLVWASGKFPQQSLDAGNNVVEFAVPYDDPRWLIAKYQEGVQYDPTAENQLEAYKHHIEQAGSHATFGGSIDPSEILAVHEPWHDTYRHFHENDIDPNDYQWLKDNDNLPDERRALEEYERFKVHTHWINIEWWLPNKTAADVEALAQKAKQQLWNRDDMAKLWKNMSSVEFNMNRLGEFGHRAEYEYVIEKLVEMINGSARTVPGLAMDWVEEQATPPESPVFSDETIDWVRRNMHEYSYNRIDEKNWISREDAMKVIGIAQQIAPLYDDYLRAALFERILETLQMRYPESYKIWPWAIKQVKNTLKQATPYMYAYLSDWSNWRHTVDVIGQVGQLLTELRQQNRLPQGFDINQHSLEEAEQWMNDWRAENVGDGWEKRDVVATLSNGYTIEDVTTQNDLNREGELMGHCVGGYCSFVASGRAKIFSLRDPKGGPHATMEYRPFHKTTREPEGYNPQTGQGVDGYEIQQIQGKQNRAPEPQYREMIKEFNDQLRAQGWSIEWAEGAWRHPAQGRAQIATEMRNEHTYHVRTPQDLDRFVEDYQNDPDQFFRTVTPPEDEYGVSEDIKVPEQWLNWTEVDGTTAQVLEQIYEGTISPQTKAEWGRALMLAWGTLYGQGSTGILNSTMRFNLGDGIVGLQQNIRNWIESIESSWNRANDYMNDPAVKPQYPDWKPKDISGLDAVKQFLLWLSTIPAWQLRDVHHTIPGAQAQWPEPDFAPQAEEPPFPGAFGSWKEASVEVRQAQEGEEVYDFEGQLYSPRLHDGEAWFNAYDGPELVGSIFVGVDTPSTYMKDDPDPLDVPQMARVWQAYVEPGYRNTNAFLQMGLAVKRWAKEMGLPLGLSTVVNDKLDTLLEKRPQLLAKKWTALDTEPEIGAPTLRRYPPPGIMEVDDPAWESMGAWIESRRPALQFPETGSLVIGMPGATHGDLRRHLQNQGYALPSQGWEHEFHEGVPEYNLPDRWQASQWAEGDNSGLPIPGGKSWRDAIPLMKQYRDAPIMEGTKVLARSKFGFFKVAADVAELAEKARQNLFTRQDLVSMQSQWVNDSGIPLNIELEGRTHPELIEMGYRENPKFNPNLYRAIFSLLNYLPPELYKFYPWVVTQMKKSGGHPWGPASHLLDILSQAYKHMEYLRSQPPGSPNAAPIPDINQMDFPALEAWVYQRNAAGVDIRDEIKWDAQGGQNEYDLGNGWKVQPVITQHDLSQEGSMMGHCVGGYCNQVEAGDTSIWSLRDAKGEPHATIEIDPRTNHVIQVQGKSNQDPIPEYKALIAQWFKMLEAQGTDVVSHIEINDMWDLENLHVGDMKDYGIPVTVDLEEQSVVDEIVDDAIRGGNVTNAIDEIDGLISAGYVDQDDWSYWMKQRLEAEIEEKRDDLERNHQFNLEQYKEDYQNYVEEVEAQAEAQHYDAQDERGDEDWEEFDPDSVEAESFEDWLANYDPYFEIEPDFEDEAVQELGNEFEDLYDKYVLRPAYGYRPYSNWKVATDWVDESKRYLPQGYPRPDPVTEEEIPEDMLMGYQGVGFRGEPHRLAIREPGVNSTHPYFKDNNLGSFLDYFVSPDSVAIGFLNTAPEREGQGYARKLVQALYDRYLDKKIIWGKIMDDAMDHLKADFYKVYPERTASIRFGRTTMYHISDVKNRDSILKNGLDPRLQRYHFPGSPTYTWMWDSLELAREAASLAWGGSKATDIWAIDATGLPIQSDPHGPYPHAFATTEPVSPERLHLLDSDIETTPREWMPEYKVPIHSNWKFGIALPAQYTENDPLDLKGKQPVFDNMQVEWWDLPPQEQEQAIVNAFRATMLSPRLKLRDNAIMYQEMMAIPAEESDPDVFEQHARDLKERWDRQGQGDILNEVEPMGWEQQVPGKLTPGFWTNIRRLAALGPYAKKLQQAALDDLEQNQGKGDLFRNEVLRMGIPGVGPKVASFAWLALNPKGSDLATIDVWMMRHLNEPTESPNNPKHYFQLEDQLRDEKDALYGPDTPLGQYQWGVWDKLRTPGLHQDHSPLKVHEPTPYTDVAWGDFARAPRPQRLPEQLPGQEQLFSARIDEGPEGKWILDTNGDLHLGFGQHHVDAMDKLYSDPERSDWIMNNSMAQGEYSSHGINVAVIPLYRNQVDVQDVARRIHEEATKSGFLVPKKVTHGYYDPDTKKFVRGDFVFARTAHVHYSDEIRHYKDEWKPGEQAYFEYHCFESEKSCDAELWHRTHQPVTVLKKSEPGMGATLMERGENGAPAVYRIQFKDGYEYDAFEDELMTDPSGYYRPDYKGSKTATVMYHISPPQNKDSILEHGLNWEKAIGPVLYGQGEHWPAGNYLFRDYEDADLSPEDDIYEVNVDGLNLEEDPYELDYLRSQNPDYDVGTFFTRDPIPPERIKLIRPSSWHE